MKADQAATLAVHPAWIEIDLARLERNLGRIRACAPGMAVIASVKANGYGHGIVPIGRRLAGAGCDMLATGAFHEAVALREAGVELPILMFGHCLPEAYPHLLRHRLIPTLHAPGQAEALERAAGEGVAEAFVKVDAGLGRLGFALDRAEAAIAAMSELGHVRIVGLYTHLPFAAGGDRPATLARIGRFADLVDRLAGRGITFRHVQGEASAGVVFGADSRLNAVCPGHALYGLEPGTEPWVANAGLERVLRAVRTRLIQAGDAGAGGGGSYGSAAAGRRGVIPFGQAQGLASPGVPSGQHVLVGGRRAAVLGISFEHAVIDLRGTDASAGEVVTLMGEDGDAAITLEEFAHWRGGSVKDALTALSGRLAAIEV